MKVEIGESLVYSWLRHIKECEIVQMNWKASPNWEMKERDTLIELMDNSKTIFESLYGLNIFKGNASIDQLIRQAEIDVLGIKLSENEPQIYAVDIAFHENGLNYGSTQETTARVVKKIIRSAICIKGYLGKNSGTIVFASPKISETLKTELDSSRNEIIKIFRDLGFEFKIEYFFNRDFENIIHPVINCIGEVADTTELFVRSIQLNNMFNNTPSINKRLAINENTATDNFHGMKIGVIARTVLRQFLESGNIHKHELLLLQEAAYSKQFFHLQFPLLKKIETQKSKKIPRYYANPLQINEEYYLLCSEWYETINNNDREYLIKWIEEKQITK